MQTMRGVCDAKALIVQELAHRGPCSLEALAKSMRSCTWNQLFSAMDELSREGTIALQPHTRFDYMISLSSNREARHDSSPGTAKPSSRGGPRAA